MKHVTIFLLYLLLFNTKTWADNFQIAFWQGSSSSYVAYSTIKLYDAANRQVFTGSTDKYGRIIIGNINNGNYRMEISFRNRTCRKMIAIDHSANFKIVNFTSTDLAFNSPPSSLHQLLDPCS